MRHRKNHRVAAGKNPAATRHPLRSESPTELGGVRAMFGRHAYLIGGLLTVMMMGLLTAAAAAFSYRTMSSAEDSMRQRSSNVDVAMRSKSPGSDQRSSQAPINAWTAFVDANFAGDQACAECHVREYEAHLRSGHSRTLTPMKDSDFAKSLIEIESYQDKRRDQTFEFSGSPDEFLVRDMKHAPNVAIPVTWLLGSGIHAQTPIAVDETTQSGVELRWSAIPDSQTVAVTPDHERFDRFAAGTIECFGRPLDSADIRACLGCHSTMTPPDSLPIRHSLVMPNVGCERCHGPRKQHVELAHAGFAEDAKPMIQYETSEAYLDACAQCHRDESSVNPDAAEHELARFQPYGIKRSRCFQRSPGNMTCSTCHDPHDTVSHDRSRSIDQCLQCHSDLPSKSPSDSPPTVCSHEPNGDCIECHMPTVPWSNGISFHDHWIRIPVNTETLDATLTNAPADSTGE